MKTYKITGYGKYAGKKDIIYGPDHCTPLTALKSFLLKEKIPYKKIQKLTSKVNKELMEKYDLTPFELASMIDFTVSLEDNYNPASGGNYRIE